MNRRRLRERFGKPVEIDGEVSGAHLRWNAEGRRHDVSGEQTSNQKSVAQAREHAIMREGEKARRRESEKVRKQKLFVIFFMRLLATSRRANNL